MDTNALALLIDVAQLGSFAAVARQRDLDPSAVSRTVAAMESDLGIRVFERTTRQMALTEAGAAFLHRTAPLLDELENARLEAADMSTRPVGTVRITASIAFAQICIVPLLPAFRAQYPDLSVDIVASDRNLDLVEDGIDIAVRLGPPPEIDVVGVRLCATRYRVCVAPGYQDDPATRLTDPIELEHRDCLRQSLPEYQSRWLFRDASERETSVAVRGSVRVSNAIALRECAENGLGPALLVDWLTSDARNRGRLIDPFPEYQAAASSFDTGIWLIYPSRRYLPLKTRTVLDFMKSRLKPRLTEQPSEQ